MNDLDRLMGAPLLLPPADFAERVMRRIVPLPQPERPSMLRTSIQWLALAGAGLPAAFQLLSFLFGMWTATTAG